ncbi:MAG: Ig-like domain-containing protein [Chloroflexota bacterium]
MRYNRVVDLILRLLVVWALLAASVYMPAAAPATAAAVPADLFISEYVEGTGANKAIELYNGTGSTVDLGASAYVLQFYFGGSATPDNLVLAGTVAHGDVFVIAPPDAAAPILAQADQLSPDPGDYWFEGADGVVLRRGGSGGTVVDSIGQPPFPPVVEWGSGLTSTADNTLRRKGTVTAGDTNLLDEYLPALEWDGYPTDTFDGLGAHALATSNSAPTLDASKSPSLNPQSAFDHTGPPAGTVGGLVSQLIDRGGPLANFADADPADPVGLALVGTATIATCTWWYTINGGANWQQVGSVSPTSALLLRADANTRLYYQNPGGYMGRLPSALTFRAWDGSSGSAGSMVDTSVNGGTTAFSSQTDAALLWLGYVTQVTIEPNLPNFGPGISPEPSSAGQTVTVRVTLHSDVSGMPGGPVTVTAGDGLSCVADAITPITPGNLYTFTGACSITFPQAGTYTIGGSFPGSGGFFLPCSNPTMATHQVQPPAATVASVSVPANATYIAGQNLDFTVNFTGPVTVNTTEGTPRIALTMGSTTRYATYVAGNGSGSLVFRYTVQAGDLDPDGITVGALDTGGGTLKGAGDVDASLILNSVGSTANVLVDGVAPGAPSTPDLTSGSDSGVSSTDNVTADNTPTFTGTAEAGSTVSLYAGATQVGSAVATGGNWAITSSALADGAHAITARATDPVGNTGPASGALGITVDTTPPAAPQITVPANGSVVATARPTFAGSGGVGHAITVAVDGSTVGSATVDGTGQWSWVPTVDLPATLHNATASQVDQAGNTGLVSATVSFTIDTIAPDTTITANPAELTGATAATFGFVGVDSESGVGSLECSLDGAPFAACASPKTYTGLGGGEHTFAVRAVDLAGNVDPTPAQYGWEIDLTPPWTSIMSPPPVLSTSTNASFYLQGGDDHTVVTFRCQLDGGPAALCGTHYDLSDLAEGQHNLSVWAVDWVGNPDPTPATYTWTVDTVAPRVVAITRLDPTPSDAATVGFGITFSEPVTGLGMADFKLTTGGNVTGVGWVYGAGSGSQYEMRVDSGSGAGTLRLDLLDSNTITDAAGHPLGGPEIGDGTFTAGEVYTLGPSATDTTISARAPYPSLSGQPVTVGFRVITTSSRGGTPTGSVTVSDGTVSCQATLVAGVGSCELVLTAAGTHALSATYGGDASFLGSTSAALDHLVNNRLPVVSAVTPLARRAGGEGFTLTVEGQDFAPVAVVRWNGVDRPTTYVDATHLTAEIAAADLRTVGEAQVSVHNPAPGGGASNEVPFTVEPYRILLPIVGNP